MNFTDESDAMAPPAISPLAGAPTSSGLRTRVISALVLAPIVLGLTYLGGAAFAGMMLIAAGLTAYEWWRLCLNATPRKRPLWLVAGVFYIALPCLAVVWLRADPASGLSTVFWLLAVIWGTDIGAYFAGRGIGGPKIAPRISPKKTWAGLAGGMIAATGVGVVTASVLELPDMVLLVAFSAVLAVVAQVGDFFESAVKRHFNVKDSGTIIPGHGGLLDRLDGLMTTAPVVAVVAYLSGEGVLAWR